MSKEHKPGCPRLQFLDGGENVPCQCDEIELKELKHDLKTRLARWYESQQVRDGFFNLSFRVRPGDLFSHKLIRLIIENWDGINPPK